MINSDYDYIIKLFQSYRKIVLGNQNGSLMFKYLVDIINNYNNSRKDKTIL